MKLNLASGFLEISHIKLNYKTRFLIIECFIFTTLIKWG